MKKSMIAGGLALTLATAGVAVAAAPGQRPMRGDANNDGGLSLSEMQQQNAARFHKLDTDGNGVISLAEFNAPLERRVQRLDANHDGKVTRDEFAAARAARQARRHAAA